jgi:hopanoid biosynthesis associated RND transporter like protein HpnN
MKPLTADSLFARLLGKLAAVIIRHPRWFIWPQVALFIAGVLLTVFFLQFDTNRDNLVGKNLKYQRNFLALEQEFPQQGNDLVVVVESDDTEKNRQFIERLAAKMTPQTNLFCDVFFQHDLAAMGTKALFFVPEDQLATIKDTLQEDRPFIQQFTQTTNLITFFEQINTDFRTASGGTNAQTESMLQALPVLGHILNEATVDMETPGQPPSPGASLFGATDVTNVYITSEGGKMFLLTTHAPNDDATGDAVDELRVLIAQTQNEVPGVNVGLTGEPVLDYDEMIQSQKDMTKATIVSLFLCALIFIYGYNETGRPVKATLCLIIGLGYTMGFTTLAVGHLNILTITFVPMLVGLAIDFGVHLITRFEEELRKGNDSGAALTTAITFTGQGIFTGALTTAAAFIAMAFTHFKGIQEMGIICGGGLLLCLVPMMTMLPALLLRGRQNVIDRHMKEDQTRARIENIWLSRPAVVIGVVLFFCGLSGMEIWKGNVKFDYNLIQMQSPKLPSVVFQQKLIHSADISILSGAIVATNLQNALLLEKEIQKLPTVADIEPPEDLLEDFLPVNQNQKLDLIQGIKAEVAPLHFSPPDTRPVDINNLSVTLYSLGGYCGMAVSQIGTNDPVLAAQFVSLQRVIEVFRREMLTGDDATLAVHATKLSVFQQAFYNSIRDTFASLQNQNLDSPLRPEDLPSALRDQFIGKSGNFLLQVFPNIDVWQRKNQEVFVADLRTIDPDATGTPVQLLEYESLLKDSYVQASWYSLIAITILVLLHFRSLLAVILALLPVAIGTMWLAGVMGVTGIAFNLANIMTLPLVIGIGVTNGIQVLNRYAEERTPGILSRSTGKAVLVSGLTAIAGFGSMILAQHRGIHSLGCVMAIGIATCMIAGLTFLPAMLNLIGRRHGLIKEPSADKLPTPGQEEPR